VIAPGGVSTSTGPTNRTTIFDLSLGYAIADVVWISVGYDNTTVSLNNSGKGYGVFRSPDAQLYLQISVLADGVLAKARR
jgi:hypothetical protein